MGRKLRGAERALVIPPGKCASLSQYVIDDNAFWIRGAK